MKQFISTQLSLTIISMLCFSCLLISTSFAAGLQQSQRSGAQLSASFQYMLSNFSGTVPSQWARLDYDPQQQEAYTLTQGFNEVRIFNRQGMEIFAFGGDGDVVSAVDISVGETGNIFILARNFRQYGIQVLNFRGQQESAIRLKNLPAQLQDFAPDRMEYQDGKLYLLDSDSLTIVITKPDGAYLQLHDLTSRFKEMAEELDSEKKKTVVFDISGFGVGPAGRIYFTAPTLFSAFRLNLDGSLDSFGTSGSGPGKFGVVSGITADDRGNIYVADRLRSVVMIFDSNFIFQGEFGYRGGRPEDMLVPDDLVIDQQQSRIFVSQAANKGVGVYKVSLLQQH